MKNFLVIALVAFGIFIATSCNEQSPTDNAVNNTTMLLKGPPTESGVVIRYQDEFITLWNDEQSGLVLGIGATDFENFCGSGSTNDILNFQDIISPSDESGQRIIEKVMGDNVSLTVWENSDWPNNIGFCELFSIEPIATGYGNFSYNDNDLNGTSETNLNRFGLLANGIVMNSDGKSYNLNAFWYGVWDGSDASTIKVTNRKVQLIATGN